LPFRSKIKIRKKTPLCQEKFIELYIKPAIEASSITFNCFGSSYGFYSFEQTYTGALITRRGTVPAHEAAYPTEDLFDNITETTETKYGPNGKLTLLATVQFKVVGK